MLPPLTVIHRSNQLPICSSWYLCFTCLQVPEELQMSWGMSILQYFVNNLGAWGLWTHSWSGNNDVIRILYPAFSLILFHWSLQAPLRIYHSHNTTHSLHSRPQPWTISTFLIGPSPWIQLAHKFHNLWYESPGSQKDPLGHHNTCQKNRNQQLFSLTLPLNKYTRVRAKVNIIDFTFTGPGKLELWFPNVQYQENINSGSYSTSSIWVLWLSYEIQCK